MVDVAADLRRVVVDLVKEGARMLLVRVRVSCLNEGANFHFLFGPDG